jgi:putative transposase
MNGFQGEKIGYVKTCKNLPNLINGQKYYSNPRISYDGKHWYLSVGLEVEEKQVELTDTVLGIDLGIKNLAICSNEVVYKNINKTKEVRRLEKKLKREQRKLSRRLENNIDHYIKVLGKDGNYHNKPIYKKEINDCKNIKKQRLKIKNLYQRLTNIRNNHLHQSTREIINTLPKAIVLETLNVKGMMKNRHLAKSIANQKFYEFKRQIDYKAKMVGIEVVYADKFYPSSRMCSCCGNIKKDLKLSDRIYKCECGLDIDRDKNASINLANYYKLA